VSSAWALPRLLHARNHRARTPVAIAGSLAAAALLALVLAGRRHEFATALSRATWPILAVTVFLQVVALVARSEAWHLSIEAAGGRIKRRILYRASSAGVLGNVLNLSRSSDPSACRGGCRSSSLPSLAR
jgi:uncharacterized membrane protein YbhN (UPF0104 family)